MASSWRKKTFKTLSVGRPNDVEVRVTLEFRDGRRVESYSAAVLDQWGNLLKVFHGSSTRAHLELAGDALADWDRDLKEAS